ncbi:MAG: BrnT family toxin [Chloroflexi bacterium]|nr:BrnT family toxin [Chloroflexota bacterium]
MQFEWDPQKAAVNERKHGVTFLEGASVFGDPLAHLVNDPDHSQTEDRFLLIGMSSLHRLLIVAFVDHDDTVRIISARTVTGAEREAYETA